MILAAVLPIPGDWIVNGGAVGLLGVVALLVFTGRLIPISTVKEIRLERDHWREIALRSMGHTDLLLPGAKLAVDIAESVQAAAQPEVRR